MEIKPKTLGYYAVATIGFTALHGVITRLYHQLYDSAADLITRLSPGVPDVGGVEKTIKDFIGPDAVPHGLGMGICFTDAYRKSRDTGSFRFGKPTLVGILMGSIDNLWQFATTPISPADPAQKYLLSNLVIDMAQDLPYTGGAALAGALAGYLHSAVHLSRRQAKDKQLLLIQAERKNVDEKRRELCDQRVSFRNKLKVRRLREKAAKLEQRYKTRESREEAEPENEGEQDSGKTS